MRKREADEKQALQKREATAEEQCESEREELRMRHKLELKILEIEASRALLIRRDASRESLRPKAPKLHAIVW